MLLGNYVYGQTWIGATNNNWNLGTNWSSGSVPIATSNVVIPSGITNFPIISSNDVTIAGLTIGDYAHTQLQITNGKSLNITGNNFSILPTSKLYLNNGSINYNGTTTINIANNTDILIELTNGSTLNAPNASNTLSLNNSTLSIDNSTFTYNGLLEVNGSINIVNSNITIQNGLQVNSGYSFNSASGTCNIYGNVSIDGTLNGGISNFTFEKNIDSDEIVVRNGGTLYMDKIDGNCPDELTKPDPTSSGSIDFKTSTTVENNGLMDLGDAVVTYYYDLDTQGDATVRIWNGLLTLKGNGTFGNTSTLEIECKGSIVIEGNGTFEQSGDIIVGNGSLSIGGNAVFANTGTLIAEAGDITFTGDVIIANTGGTIDAGSSEITFEGGTIQNDGTFEADSSTFIFAGTGDQTITGNDITFYELVVSDSSTIVSSVNITVENDLTIEGGGDIGFEESSDAELITNFPYIVGYLVTAYNQLTITFSQEVTIQSSENTNNYQIQKGGINQTLLLASRSATNTSEVTLTLETSFFCGATYSLTIDDVQNVSGKQVKDILQ